MPLYVCYFRYQLLQKHIQIMGGCSLCCEQSILLKIDHANRPQSKPVGGSQRKRHMKICNEKENQSSADLQQLDHEVSAFLGKYEQDYGKLTMRMQIDCRETSRHNLEQQIGSIFENKQKLEYLKQQQPEKGNQVALQNDNIKLHLEEESSEQSLGSVDLSLPTKVLDQSLFTDRMILKQLFHDHYLMFGKQLKDWAESERKTYEVDEGECRNLAEKEENRFFSTIFETIRLFCKKNCIQLISFCSRGIKIYANGEKRLFALDFEDRPALIDIVEHILSKCGYQQPRDLIYLLTNWIPEDINIDEVRSISGIFEKVKMNIEDGNNIITLSRTVPHKDSSLLSKGKEQSKRQFAILKSIDLKQENLVVDFLGKHSIPEMFMEEVYEDGSFSIKFDDFASLFDSISLNWNPSVYDIIHHKYGLLSPKDNPKQYLLTIPPSEEDIEIRLFLEIHHSYCSSRGQAPQVGISLYDYEGTPIDQRKNNAIREIQSKGLLFSDVFVFEGSEQKSQYILALDLGPGMDMHYSLRLLSFIDINFRQAPAQIVLKQLQLQSEHFPCNAGQGMNSPFFLNNLQYSLKCESNHKIIFKVNAPDSFKYELMFIPDPLSLEDVTKIHFENLVGKAVNTEEKVGNSSSFLKAEYSSYVVMLHSFSEVDCQLGITVSLHGNPGDNKDSNYLLEMNPLACNLRQASFLKEFKWLPFHSGKRKRLKSNSSQSFQPSETFAEFFRNPVVDRHMDQGKYQFYVKSKTYEECFCSSQGRDRGLCEPPPLSLAVLLGSEDKKSFKIIVDDAFYVPFGMGFWSKEVYLDEGDYRFVIPKLTQDFSKGFFGIIRC